MGFLSVSRPIGKESNLRQDIRIWLFMGPESGDSLALLNHSSGPAMRCQSSNGSPDSEAASVNFRPRKYFLKALKSVIFSERIADSPIRQKGVALVTALVYAEGGWGPY